MKKFKKKNKKNKPDGDFMYKPYFNDAKLTQKSDEEVDFERLEKFIDKLATKEENRKQSLGYIN